MGGLSQGAHGAAEHLLVRPGGLVDDGGGGVGGVDAAGEKLLLCLPQKAGGEEEDHGAAVRGHSPQGLPFWDAGAAGHAGDDYRLGYLRQGVLRPEGRCRAAEGGDAGGKVVGDTQPVQSVHLFPDRSVQAGVSGVEADGGVAGALLGLHDGEDLLQGHGGAVIDDAAVFLILEQVRVY